MVGIFIQLEFRVVPWNFRSDFPQNTLEMNFSYPHFFSESVEIPD